MATVVTASDRIRELEVKMRELLDVGEKVRMNAPAFAMLVIFASACDLVRTVIQLDPTSIAGQIALGEILDDMAWKLGNTHPAFEKLRQAGFKLNPRAK